VSVRYLSTRGNAPELDFGDALLTGLAADGGLYCPAIVPGLPSIDSKADDYQSTALSVIKQYTAPTFSESELAPLIDEAYRSFRHSDICPVFDLGGDQYLLDLAQGPTLAFKDVALQLVGRLLEVELAKRGRKLTILGATSGDTGSAAIEALANKANIEVVILHPLDRVSEVQRRQMTTVDAPNIHNIAIRGTFDDCQDLVKASFADESLRDEVSLGAVNSINWARVMAQIVYYVTAARSVRPKGELVSFVVPTGNFGNVLAGWYAKRMGLAVDRLVVASNRNDVLTRFFETGWLSTAVVEPSLSPSMDIQISSNFERLLWEASGRDGDAIASLLTELRSEGAVAVPSSWCEVIRAEFDFYRVDDAQTSHLIGQTANKIERIIDPHTAVGLGACLQHLERYGAHRSLESDEFRRSSGSPVIVLATAAAAKFPDAVEAATGHRPQLPLHLTELMQRRERFEIMDQDQTKIGSFLRSVSSP